MRTRPSGQTSNPPARQRFKDLSVAAIVAVVTLLVYLPALKNGFVNWDDGPYVFSNPHIRSFNADFWRWAFFDFYSYNWHPLTWLSHAVDYAFWGLNPLGHHLTNVLLHAANTFLAVLLSAALFSYPGRASSPGSLFARDRAVLVGAAATGLLFGIHPVHVESVAWVAERKDLLCAFFFFLSVMSYLKHAADGMRTGGPGSSSPGRHAGPIVFFVLALLSKPMAVSLPLVLLILDWYPSGRITSLRSFRSAVAEKIPYLVLSAASAVITLFAQHSGGALELSQTVPLASRLLVSASAFVRYLGTMLWPLDLLAYYPYPHSIQATAPQYLISIALLAAITGGCIAARKKRPVLLATWLYYVVVLLPVIGIVQVGAQSMADRYTYLPSMGPFLLAGIGAAWFANGAGENRARSRTVKIAGIALAIALVCSLAVLCVRQIAVWRDDLTLWQSIIEKEGNRVLFAYFKRGQALALRGYYDESIRDYDRVIAENYEENARVYKERGFVYLKAGRPDRAVLDLKKACSLGDTFACRSLSFVEVQGREAGSGRPDTIRQRPLP